MANKGLLLVTMEPAAGAEDEFNDLRHRALRAACRPAWFQSASRSACIEGWPRYVAIYDLEGTAALDTDAYRAVSVPNSTSWSKRVAAAIR